ncbi:hypothetical protein B0H19DRAFT_1260261 [Mycena capillaripes]|nr:hypothetical protein B0H19DRAFT_1260261 [Mycena capillaripes]
MSAPGFKPRGAGDAPRARAIEGHLGSRPCGAPVQPWGCGDDHGCTQAAMASPQMYPELSRRESMGLSASAPYSLLSSRPFTPSSSCMRCGEIWALGCFAGYSSGMQQGTTERWAGAAHEYVAQTRDALVEWVVVECTSEAWKYYVKNIIS